MSKPDKVGMVCPVSMEVHRLCFGGGPEEAKGWVLAVRSDVCLGPNEGIVVRGYSGEGVGGCHGKLQNNLEDIGRKGPGPETLPCPQTL